MKKMLRFAALTAVLGLTFWLPTGNQALAAIPCSFEHGRTCTGSPGWVVCGTGNLCYCIDGHWDCGCVVDPEFGLICPGA
jgi:hypothetical protein